MKEQRRIAIYSRKSRFTGKGESIENQIELCRQYIRSNSGQDAAEEALVYEDEGFSGGNLERPQFKQMMADVKEGKLSAIVVYRLDRISRNIGDFAGLIESLHDMKIAFVSIKEQFDTNSPMGRAMMYIASVFSQLERETIAERIRDNMQELAKTGRWLGGITPTGYASEQVQRVTVDGKVRKACKLEILPQEAEVVRTIFAKFLETCSLSNTDAFLLQQGYTSKNGKNFTRFAIKGILTNPVYAKADDETWEYLSNQGAELFAERGQFDGTRGVMAYNRTEQKPGKSNRLRPVQEWIIALGAHAGLVRGNDWVKAQCLLEQNRSKGYRKPRSHVALLSGVLLCGNCGAYMRPKLSTRENAEGELSYAYVCEMKERSRRQRCKMRNLSGNLLDTAVVEEIKRLPENNDQFRQHLKEGELWLQGIGEGDKRQMERLQKLLTEKEQEITPLLHALGRVAGSAAEQYLLDCIEQLHRGINEVRRQIAELARLTAENAMVEMQLDVLRQMLASFPRAVDGMSVEQKRAAIRTCVRKVVWDGKEAHVYLFGSDDDYELPERPTIGGNNDDENLEPLGENSK